MQMQDAAIPGHNPAWKIVTMPAIDVPSISYGRRPPEANLNAASS